MAARVISGARETLRSGPRPLDGARWAMMATRQWDSTQSVGRGWAIGCVALEITQRCNLDCGACYLSEHSQAVKDLPMEEIFRRIDIIHETYGSDVDVQVTGGDPTLRKREDLITIVRRLSQLGMRPALFTNGIRASRDLLVDLTEVGLVDVAFHVDLTQGRHGYHTEQDLNELRRTYIERARGLPLSVYFNTTIFDGNFDQIPDVVAFFVQNSDMVRLASFQPMAQTGRGTLGARSANITIPSVVRQIEQGAGADISFDTAHIGHSSCNRYATTFVANNHVYDGLDDRELYERLVEHTAGVRFDRRNRRRALMAFLRCVTTNPLLVAKGVRWLARKLWQMKTDLVAGRGQVNKLSFFIHNFMDACALDPERLAACIFMVATEDGPVSMCAHNARRDAHILKPVRLQGPNGDRYWNPLSATITDTPSKPADAVARSRGRRVRLAR